MRSSICRVSRRCVSPEGTKVHGSTFLPCLPLRLGGTSRRLLMMTLHGAAAIILAAAVTAPPAPPSMAMDTPVSFGGIQVVCTGVGSAKDDPQWASCPIRIEFSNNGAQYLSGAH